MLGTPFLGVKPSVCEIHCFPSAVYRCADNSSSPSGIHTSQRDVSQGALPVVLSENVIVVVRRMSGQCTVTTAWLI